MSPEKDDIIKALAYALELARPFVAHASTISREAKMALVMIDAAAAKVPKKAIR